MTTTGTGGLSGVARMEWRKLRTIRSTYWILLVFAAGMVGAAVVNGAPAPCVSKMRRRACDVATL